MTIDERIGFLRSLMPIPYEPNETGTFMQFANIPPLFSKNLKLNVDGTCRIQKSEGSWPKGEIRGFTLRWLQPARPLGRLRGFYHLAEDFDQYFYMTEFFRDVQGLDDYVDKSLLARRLRQAPRRMSRWSGGSTPWSKRAGVHRTGLVGRTLPSR
jgi:hypothetical protein